MTGRELPIQAQLLFALSGPIHPQLESLIEIHEFVKLMTEMEICRSMRQPYDEVCYARMRKRVRSFIDELNTANGR